MKILHFVTDEKFIPFVQTVYDDAFPGANEYRVSARGDGPLRFVRPGSGVSVKGPLYWRSPAVARDMRRFDCVVVHYMRPEFIKALMRAPEDVLVVWSGWGGDYYGLFESFMGPFVLPDTAAAVRRIGPPPRSAARRAKDLLKRLLPSAATVRAVAERIDVVSVLPSEIDMLRRALPRCTAHHVHLQYYSVEETFEPGPREMRGPDILLGNSASPENNHVEALQALSRLDLGDRSVITPLSYGDPRYAAEIVRVGRELLGRNFVPVTRFVSLPEYHEMIASCGCVIMNHVRQQAVGTVSTALFKGAAVVLRRENPVFSLYRDLGVRMRTWDGSDGVADLLRPLDPAATAENRAIVGRFWSHERVVENIRKLRSPAVRGRRARWSGAVAAGADADGQ